MFFVQAVQCRRVHRQTCPWCLHHLMPTCTCAQYDEVSAALKAARMAELLAKDPERAQRMTGKQYFTKNQNATAADLEVR